MTEHEKVMEILATYDQRLKKIEEFIAEAKGELFFDGVCLDGTPDYVREYITKKGGE